MSTLIKRNALLTTTILALGIGGGFFYLKAQDKAIAATPVVAEQPAISVAIETVENKPVQIWKSFSGRLEAVDYAEIRPQISGTITEIHFEDGQDVAENDVLYVIDPRPYKAAIAQADSELGAARNRAELARKELVRAQSLIKTEAISQRIFDERSNAASIAQADVKTAEARYEQAKISLDYAYVKAPFSGRVSRAEVTKGNLVQAGPNAPILTSVVSNDGIYANFEVDEQTYLAYVRNGARGQQEEAKIPVKLILGDNQTGYEGFIHSFDNKIDASSGTIRARALFKNEEGTLLPGMFATIEVGSPSAEEKIAISERAIGTDQDRKFVYVVNSDSKTTYREVKLGESMDGRRIVLSGLDEGERIVTDGIIRIRPDMLVKPQATLASDKEALLVSQPVKSE